jgi:hypothetical protein
MWSLFFLVINSKYFIAKREMHSKEDISYCKKEGIDKEVDKQIVKEKHSMGEENHVHLLAYEWKKMSH